MPSTIPYDPSLILGNIVSQEKLDNIIQISALQAPADAAQSNMNSLISLKRSIDMTVQELVDMNIDVTDLITESDEIGQQLQQAAVDYGKAKVAAEKAIQPLMSKVSMVSDEIESPIDYNKSQIKQMAISTDSLQMNVQYFSNDENDESSSSHASTVSSFVNETTSSIFGPAQASQASGNVQTQVNSQVSRHSIAGTLVICITCTHKNAQVFAPFILDVDKAVRAWNKLFPDNMIKTNDAASIALIEATAETPLDPSFSLLSGATYGSSFVGMVHILNTTDTASSQSMESVAASMQESFSMGGWFASETGSFGVAASFADSAKNLLSTQTVQSHCSLVTMGIIPSIKSNKVNIGVQGFSKFDPATDMESLARLQNATANENNTIAAGSSAAKTGKQMITLQNSKVESTLSGLETIDAHQDSIIDTNSMMTAMDDYIQKCIAGGNNLGVPVNYYLKPITQSLIARSWIAKYYPNKYNQSGSADDSTKPPTPAS
jgi:hypothetical protein